MRPCGHLFQIATDARTARCSCGRESIGRCVDCGQALCGLHGSGNEHRLNELSSRWPRSQGWMRERSLAKWNAAVDRLGIPAWNTRATLPSGSGVADTFSVDSRRSLPQPRQADAKRHACRMEGELQLGRRRSRRMVIEVGIRHLLPPPRSCRGAHQPGRNPQPDLNTAMITPMWTPGYSAEHPHGDEDRRGGVRVAQVARKCVLPVTQPDKRTMLRQCRTPAPILVTSARASLRSGRREALRLPVA
jgi:hypothetical protein